MKKILIALFTLGFLTQVSAAPQFPYLEPGVYLSAHITTATTTLVYTGAGALRRICVGTPAAAGTVTVDDAITATNTVAGPITTPSAAGNPYCLDYNLPFYTGLTIVTTGAQEVTVLYSH